MTFQYRKGKVWHTAPADVRCPRCMGTGRVPVLDGLVRRDDPCPSCSDRFRTVPTCGHQAVVMGCADCAGYDLGSYLLPPSDDASGQTP